MIPGHFTIADARLWRALCALHGPPEPRETADDAVWRVGGEIRALAEVGQAADVRWSLPARHRYRMTAAATMDLMTREP